MSLAPGTMGAMKKTGLKDILGKRIAARHPRKQEPTEALMARDLAAWKLARSAIAKARGGWGT